MNDKNQAVFYVWAAIHMDIERDEADEILLAEGLHTSTHALMVCQAAIRKWINITPAGPTYDVAAVREKIARQRLN